MSDNLGSKKGKIKSFKRMEVRPNFGMKEERDWYENLRYCGINILQGGWIGFAIWQKDENGDFKIVSFRQVKDIDTAIRMQYHILDSYQKAKTSRSEVSEEFERYAAKVSEIETLSNVEMIIRQVNYLLVNWRSGNASQKKEIESLAARTILLLGQCRNEEKKNVIAEIQPVETMLDSLDRINPGAMAARTIGALGSLARRLNQIGMIMPIIAMRISMLELEKQNCERAIKAADLLLLITIRDWKKISSVNQKGNKEKMIKSLDRIMSRFNNVFFSPYYDLAAKAKANIRDAKAMIECKDLEEAVRFISLTRENLKIK